MVNTEISDYIVVILYYCVILCYIILLTIFLAAKDGEALYSQQKQDWELTVTQIMNSLLQTSDLK